jgi:hypothetical protein
MGQKGMEFLDEVLYVHVTGRRCRFHFNNQPESQIFQIYCHKTLHVSGIITWCVNVIFTVQAERNAFYGLVYCLSF